MGRFALYEEFSKSHQRTLDNKIREYVYREALFLDAEVKYELAKIGKEISHYGGVSKVQNVRSHPDTALSFAKRAYEKGKETVENRKKEVLRLIRHGSFEDAIKSYRERNPSPLSPKEHVEEENLQKEIAQVLHDHRGKIKGDQFNF
jgi:predicted S18 family serine protease